MAFQEGIAGDVGIGRNLGRLVPRVSHVSPKGPDVHHDGYGFLRYCMDHQQYLNQ